MNRQSIRGATDVVCSLLQRSVHGKGDSRSKVLAVFLGGTMIFLKISNEIFLTISCVGKKEEKSRTYSCVGL